MSEHDQHSTTEPGLVNEVKEKIGPAFTEGVKRAQPVVDEARQKLQQVEVSTRVNVVQVITCVATVGILWTTRRQFKFSKRVVKNMDKQMLFAQDVIKTLREQGQQFTFYPGVGIYVD